MYKEKNKTRFTLSDFILVTVKIITKENHSKKETRNKMVAIISSSPRRSDSKKELKASEIQQIVFDYFLHEGLRRPEDYMKEIVKEIAGRTPEPSELHYASKIYKWIKNTFYTIENYILQLIYDQHISVSELDPMNIFYSYQDDYSTKLSPRDFWLQIITLILQDHGYSHGSLHDDLIIR